MTTLTSPPSTPVLANVIGCILAGGEARRMSGEIKALVRLNGKTLISHIEHHFQQSHINQWIVSTSRKNDAAITKALSKQSATIIDEYHAVGPLGGLLTSLQWLKKHYPNHLLYTCPCDTPFLTETVFTKLFHTLQTTNCDGVVAKSQSRIHPTIGLWRPTLVESLRQRLTSTSNYRVMDWLNSINSQTADLSQLPEHFFANINRYEDIQTYEMHTTNE